MGLRDIIYTRLNRLSGGSLDLVRAVLARFDEVHAREAAASMTFYALLSVFPLILVLVSLGSFVLDTDIVVQQLMASIAELMPSYEDRIRQDIEQVIGLRGTIGVVGFVVLLWSATGFFNTLTYNVNRAWVRAEMPGFIHRRLMALVLVIALAFLLILSVISTAAVNLLSMFSVPLRGSVAIYNTMAWSVGAKLIPVIFRFLSFVGLYRWVPTATVRWREAFWGALLGAMCWEVTTLVFAWFVGSRWARFELIYGSLGAIVALMMWIYLSNFIFLLGAHLSAAIGRRG